MLEFNVNNQIIERCDSFRPVADSKNYLKAEFNFSEEWQGNIIAVFGDCNENFYDVVLEDGKCVVPWEVIRAPFFTVSVFCGDLVTANALRVEVERSGYREGNQPSEPTPDVYSQLINAVKSPYIGENGNWFVWNKEKAAFEDTKIGAGIFETGLSIDSVQSENSTAGGRGFKLTAFVNNNDGTGICTLRTVDGLEVGMSYAMQANYACVGVITAIDGLNITIDGVPGNVELKADIAEEDIGNYFIIVDKPQLGDFDVGINAVSMGSDCLAQNMAAFAAGRENVVILPYGASLGRENIAGYAAFASGYMNEAAGGMSFVSGHQNKALGNEAVANGKQTQALGNRSSTFGFNTIAQAPDQFVLGKNNIPYNGKYVLIVGNGETQEEPSNAHTVSWAGDGWFKKSIRVGGKDQENASIIRSGSKQNSFIMGNSSVADIAGNCIALGAGCKVGKDYGLAGGYWSEANGAPSFAFGEFAKANANGSSAFGNNVVANRAAQFVCGMYNSEDYSKAFIVGGGNSSLKKNIYALDWDGNGEFAGTVKAGRATSDSDNDLVLVTKGYLKAYVDAAIKAALSDNI